MRNLHQLDEYRMTGPGIIAAFGSVGDEICGAFQIPSPIDGRALRVLASSDAGWDHVSVSREERIPSWSEMSAIHALFFLPEETAMQLHVPSLDHIDYHPFCLHLWRPHDTPIPRPPGWMVGPAGVKRGG